MLSGLTTYLFVRTLCRSRSAGLVAGLGYVLCFWHTQQVLVMGRLPLSLFYAVLPLPYYYFERGRKGGSGSSEVFGALSLAALVFTHPGYGLWAFLFYGLYAFSRCLLIPTGSRSSAARTFFWILTGGIVLSLPLTLPMWVERGATALRLGLSMFDDPSPSWHHLLVWSNYAVSLLPRPEGQEHWYGGYLGISLVLAALAGTLACLHPRRRHRSGTVAPLALALAVSLLIVMGYRWPILRNASVVTALGACRYLLFTAFFLSSLAGAATQALPVLLPRRLRALAAAPVLLLMVADLGPTTFRYPYYPDVDAWPVRDAGGYESLRKLHPGSGPDELPTFRTLHLSPGGYALNVNAWTVYRIQMATPSGVYNESPYAVLLLAQPLDLRMSREVLASASYDTLHLSEAVRGALYLLNVRYVVAQLPGDGSGHAIQVWSFPFERPVIVSSRLAEWPSWASEPDADTRLERLVGEMRIDWARAVSDLIPVTGHPSRDLGTSPDIEVLGHTVRNQSVELHVRTTAACFARLAYAYYPSLDVRVDGEPVTPFQTADGFIALELTEGEHAVTFSGRLSLLRRSLFGLNALLLCGVGSFFVIRRHRSRKTGERFGMRGERLE